MPRNKLIEKQSVFHIPSSKERVLYYLDLSLVKSNTFHLVIAPEANIDLLVQNGQADIVLEVEISDHVWS